MQFYCLPDIGECFLPRVPLTDAPREARNGNGETAFLARLKNDTAFHALPAMPTCVELFAADTISRTFTPVAPQFPYQ